MFNLDVIPAFLFLFDTGSYNVALAGMELT